MKAADWAYFDAGFVAMAHRGGALLPANARRENTLIAFRNAVDLGYRYLETDVHVTRDGHLVAFHDATLDRVTDSRGAIADLPLAEIRRARIGNEQVPTLDEVLDNFDVRVNIDIKANGAEAPLVHALRRHNAWHRVCVGSFSQVRLARFRALAKNWVATSCGPVGVATAVAASRSGFGIAPRGAAFQVPVRHHVAGRVVEVVTPAFVAQAHRWGKQVHVWTIDDPQQMSDLIDMGVDGLVTDRPDLLRQVLESRGMWG